MRILPVGFIAFGLAFSPGAPCDEMSERAAVRSEVAALVAGERFADLEALAAKHRSSKSRTSSGLWQLTLFYSGVSAAFDSRRREEEFWLRAERSAAKWIADYPQSATARLANAKRLIGRAWSYRGSGYANTVDPRNWQPFNDHVEQARVYLEKYKDIASTDPHWYELMAIVGYAQQWPEPRFSALIAEGLKREPQFYQTYFAALDYYAPKWGGSAEEIERFAKAALERTRATEGSGMYARIYWYASQTQYDDRLFSESQVDWAVMKQGIDDVLKKYPDSWNVNNFARFACLSRDKAKTAELIARVKDAPIPAVWRNPSFQQCKAWASS